MSTTLHAGTATTSADPIATATRATTATTATTGRATTIGTGVTGHAMTETDETDTATTATMTCSTRSVTHDVIRGAMIEIEGTAMTMTGAIVQGAAARPSEESLDSRSGSDRP